MCYGDEPNTNYYSSYSDQYPESVPHESSHNDCFDKLENLIISLASQQDAYKVANDAAIRNLEDQVSQLLVDVKSQYIESSPSDMENLYVDEVDGAQVEISMEDASEDPIDQSSEDVLIYKEENTMATDEVKHDAMYVKKPVEIVELELETSNVANKTIVMFEAELTRNLEYVVY